VTLRLLADENVHSVVVHCLRGKGYDVEWVLQSSPGISDENILAREDIGELVLITYDSDFGELIFHRQAPRPLALIYSRLGRVEPRYIAERIAEVLELPPQSAHCYVITKTDHKARAFGTGNMRNA